MARKRRNVNTKNNAEKKKMEFHEPDPNSEDYIYDEVDKFHQSKDKIMLDQNLNEDEVEVEESDEEVMAVKDSEDESSDNDVDDSSAEEKNEEDGLPDSKAWGRSKKIYYDADVQDDDVYASDEEAEMAAAEEEKEAMSLQKRLHERLDAEDFYKISEKDTDVSEELEKTNVTTDLSKLSKREKLEILSKQSPELLPLIDECKEKLEELENKYHPLLLMAKRGLVPNEQGKRFIYTKHRLLLSYCVNITFYLSLKANKTPTRGHPVFACLLRLKNYLSKLDALEHKLASQITVLLSWYQSGEWVTMQAGEQEIEKVQPKRKKAKKLQEDDVSDANEIHPLEYYNLVKRQTEKKKLAAKINISDAQMEEDEDEDGKRKITYEMSKNKGLMRKRKREMKNPRVKHKLKFKKAQIKHKGQVREVQRENTRYGGELTGIKPNLTRSTKIR